MDTKTKEELPEVKISVKDLYEAASHFGHQTQRWNPKMKTYIFGERNGLYIIDLAKTLQQLRYAVAAIRKVAARGGAVLFVGTKKQAREVIKTEAERCGEFHITQRWLGGTLTNLGTIRRSIKRMEKIEKKISGGGEGLTKKELGELTKNLTKLQRNLEGIRTLRKPPEMVVIVDPREEHIAVKEAKKLNIPIMALTDTNCDPDSIDYVIPCNDDTLKGIRLIVHELTDAVIEEKDKRKSAQKADALKRQEEEASKTDKKEESSTAKEPKKEEKQEKPA